ncbi:hypothetical protein SAMN02745165_03257 [Malonomonas rubra DSM 5091]|uniref:Uncharacterized protein n=1 Tax=Malonomonas rubra DSM 5091 TaxID=1122189 RepID=A0A1M6MDG9_MALRU|nr:tetratricopeptide repeat protein [Malonomonas rubra]SHJ81504.1 hypothetical protein SAMN02745165_03257 [Malonomonas rubra DSM 5091]
MSYPTQIIKILGIALFLLLFFLSSVLPVRAASRVTLTGIEKKEDVGRTLISFNFTSLPEFAVESSGQRVDLLLQNVWVSAQMRKLPEDETVVKILFAQKQQELLTSLLLRRAPVEVRAESKLAPPRIEMELLWEGDTQARPGVAFRISDMPVRKAGKKAQEFEQKSPWDGRWNAFFREYRSDFKITIPQKYSLPSLPKLVMDSTSPLLPLQQFADEGKWLSLIRKAGQLQGLTVEQQEIRDLLLSEAQLRTDAVAAALYRLEQLQDQQTADPVRVDYLTAYAEAVAGQPMVAELQLQELLPTLDKTAPLTSYCYLLAAETALAGKKPQQALDYLKTEKLPWPTSLLSLVDLRTADARAGLGELKEAVELYRELEEEEGLYGYYPAACNRAATSAFKVGEYATAGRFYGRLGEQQLETGADLVQFAIGSSAYEAGDIDWGVIGLQKATLDWPGTEGGERAELRLIDHKLISGDEFELAKAATSYAQLAQHSAFRKVREEAFFKRGLSLYLLAEHRESINDLMRFRREFGSSELRREADLLLLKQIPIVVNKLLQQGNDFDAVVLVEQNRKLLLRGGVDQNFLQDLAESFENLGLYPRAGRVLLYLYDRAKSESERKPLYLPLARTFLKRGEYSNASDYADRYLKKYPRGKDAGAIFGLLLDAFEKQGRTEEMIAWLERKNRPSSPELESRAAWIYWQQQRYEEVVRSLEKALKTEKGMPVKEMALLAEAYYQLRRNAAADEAFFHLQDDPEYASQARYRRAQILLRAGKKRSALNLLAKLVEEDGNSPWGKLAQDLLIQEKR